MGQYLLAQSWLLEDDGDLLRALHVREGMCIEASGTLRETLLGRAPLSAADRALAAFDHGLGLLIAARDAAPPVEATRAAVLRGTGWAHLFIELTGQCNERCTHCYADAGPSRVEELDWETLEGVIEDGAALGFENVQLTGGDPLLSRHVVRAAHLVRECGVSGLEIYTNGLALGPDLYGELREAGASFAFSMYSAEAAEHDAITLVPKSHARTSRAIQRALDGGSKVRVGIVSMNGDAPAVERTRKYVASLGVPEDAISSDVQRAVGRGVISPETLVRSGAVHRGGNPAGSDRQSPLSGKSRSKHAFSGTAAVAYDGRVHPCIFSRRTTLGSIHRERLRDILEAPLPVARVDVSTLPSAAYDLTSHLSCWECRLRASLLGHDHDGTTAPIRR